MLQRYKRETDKCTQRVLIREAYLRNRLSSFHLCSSARLLLRAAPLRLCE